MKAHGHTLFFQVLCCAVGAALALPISVPGADETPLPSRALPPNQSPQLVDLPTVLRLAGAQNIDVQIARERIAAAEANRELALWQIFPSISPGVTYRRHDNLIQDVTGNIVEVHKQAYTVGPALAAQLDLGEAIYRNLAAKQSVKAAEFGRDTQRQESMLAALDAYLGLLRAKRPRG